MPSPPFCQAQPGTFLLREGQTVLSGAPAANPAPGLARCRRHRGWSWPRALPPLPGTLRRLDPWRSPEVFSHQAGSSPSPAPVPKILSQTRWHLFPLPMGAGGRSPRVPGGCSPFLISSKKIPTPCGSPKIPRAPPGQEPALLLPSLGPEAPRTALAVPTLGVSGLSGICTHLSKGGDRGRARGVGSLFGAERTRRRGDKTPGAILRRGFKEKVGTCGDRGDRGDVALGHPEPFPGDATRHPLQTIPRCPPQSSCSTSAGLTSPKHPPKLPLCFQRWSIPHSRFSQPSWKARSRTQS